jgi:hypothetical protein
LKTSDSFTVGFYQQPNSNFKERQGSSGGVQRVERLPKKQAFFLLLLNLGPAKNLNPDT